MKKFILICLSMLSIANADFDKNFSKAIKDSAGIEVSVQSKKQLKSLKGQYFVIGRTSNGEIFPVIVSDNGKYFIGLSSVMHFEKEDSKMITDEILKAGKEKEAADSKALNKLIKQFSDKDFVYLQGNSKNLPTMVVVTDPDCPYCRKELDEVEKRLNEANLKLIFAPVHEKEAFVKSQLILNETSKLKQNATKEKIAILRKYYSDMKLSQKQLDTNIKQVQHTTNVIFDSNLVRGVPFIFEEK